MVWTRRALIVTLTLVAKMALGFDVAAKSAIILDAETGKVLWEKNSRASMYPASTTKIMTGLLLVERYLPSEILVAPKDVDKIGESSMHLKAGEKVSARDMLYAMMLRSANDGCYTVAVNVSGSVPSFAKLMNDRAKAIGCVNTNFTNPNGLHDKNHTTCAYDLALMGREAMKYESFRDVVKTWKHLIKRSINQADRAMISKNKWLKKDMTADGIKTGYTNPAGHTYVGSATRDGYRIITVVMKSDHWQLDHQEMLNWAYKNHERVTICKKGDVLCGPTVTGGVKASTTLVSAEEVSDILPRGSDRRFAWTFNFPEGLPAPLKAGTQVGTATVRDDSGWSTTVPLMAGEDVDKASILARSGSNSLGFGMIAGTLGIGAFFVRSKAKKRRRKFYGKARTRSRII